MNVARRRGFGDVHVPVGVEPDNADVFFLLAIEMRHAGGYTRRDGMIAAQDERQKRVRQRFLDDLGHIDTGFRDFLQIFCALFADRHFFRLLHFEIADVFDGVAEFFDGGLQACTAESRRAHVHAAAALAEVHGNADDSHFLRHGLIRER